MMKSNRVSETQLEFINKTIFPPLFIGGVFALVGGYITYEGLQTDWTAMDKNTGMLAMGLLFCAGGILGALLGPRSHIYLFDKAEGLVSYTCKKLTGTTSSTFPTEGMNRILITKKRQKSSSDSSSKKITYTYLLEYEGGDTVELGKVNKSYSRSVLSSSNSPRPEAVQELAAFLDLPVEELGFKEVFTEMKNTITELMDKRKSEES